ncbi:hypothetical protein COCOR_07428 [Corallococcus coralloides DSM 2259]|uniref:Outer membrane protein beta-barrel domain-containing protein n=1 Tax=Corallococcus coralloides (strain ATCC 25202 / DSM 2259 / NBRC 100086 / M2) TaxID=1144275 RepID=H8MMP5_CORCM|nr:hypothetical protein [Corallococcus coralloides]AFE07534.1 hypothetical protein COCOR_07428 [Corallococcus coralloides DSM 2259]
MKAKILAGAIAALMYGTGAGAAEKDCPPGQAAVPKDQQNKDMSAQSSQDGVQEEDLLIEEAPVDESLQGTGGSGSSGSSLDDSSKSSKHQGTSDTGGSGVVYLNTPMRCEPLNESGTGGSGTTTPQSEPLESAPQAQPPAVEPPAPPPPPSGTSSGGMSQRDSSLYGEEATGGSGLATTPPPAPSYTPSASTNEDIKPLEVEKKSKNDKKGLTLLIGGGVEGYTGALAPQIAPGPSAAVTASLKPTSVLGIEVGYSGALNNIKDAGAAGAEDGPDLVRNGGQAALTVAVTPTAVQPYLLGGIGISNYHFRGGESLGYSDDTVGNIPAGVGVRGHFGHFTADLRGYYNFLFDKQFAPNIDPGGDDPSGGGSYTTTLNVGGTF